jgi:nicotinamidase-related amidase
MLSRQRTGLIIIDVQGKLARIMHESEAMHEALKSLVAGAKALDLPVVWLEQNPGKLGSTSEELLPLLSGHKPIPKFTFSACGEPDFVDAIEESGVHTWLVAGIEAHICVYQTVRDLIELGRKVEVVTDCVSSRTPANREIGLNRMVDAGARLTSVEMCLFELVGSCRVPEFREILNVIK